MTEPGEATGTEVINLAQMQEEADRADAAEMADIPYEQWRPPRITVIHPYAVLCPAATCGVVALRDTKPPAEQAAKEHRDIHIAMNKRAALLMKRFQEQGAQFAPGRVGPPEVEVKSLDQLDKAEKADPEVLPDHGYLDWQWGSDATGRDPAKMWHRGKCGGEVIVINHVRACTGCGRADTEDGRIPIVDFGEEEGTDGDS